MSAQLDPAKLTPANLAAILTRGSDERVTEEMVRADIAAGAPVNRDGTLHLIHYAAWLCAQVD